METHGSVTVVTPEELEQVLARLEKEGGSELAIVRDHYLEGVDLDDWPESIRGRNIYRLVGPSDWLPTRIARLSSVRSLALRGLNMGAEAAESIARNLNHLISLDLTANRIGPTGAQALARGLKSLTHLDLTSNGIGDTGASAIAEGLGQLDSLSVQDNGIQSAGALTIARRLHQLSALDIGYNQVGDNGARAIARTLTQLWKLNVSSNDVGPEGAKAIAEYQARLTVFRSSFNKIGDEGVVAIARRLSRLTELQVGWSETGKDGATEIARHLGFLTRLEICNNPGIGSPGAKAIAESLRRLVTLDIGSAGIGENDAMAIAKNLLALRSLQIGWNSIREAGARAIGLNLTHLRNLDVSGNELGSSGAQAVSQKLQLLNTLGIHYNQLGDAGAATIAEHLPHLTSLGIGQNGIGPEGAEAISTRLKNLRTLHIYGNRIGNAGARSIARNLSQLYSLTADSNEISDDGAAEIAQHLHRLVVLTLGKNPICNSGVGEISRHLKHLTILSLAEIKQVSDIASLAPMTQLKNLNISNTSVADLSPFADRILAGWNVSWEADQWGPGVEVRDCPLVRPSVEIAAQGPEAVRNYFRELATQGSDRLYEAKVLILGEGGAGKTSLLRRLYAPDRPLPSADESTRGIDIHRHEFRTEDGRKFRLNVWDFGGQQIYHATHQFFLTCSSLYILVDDTRANDRSIHDKGFKFWLEVVESLSDASPLLIFQNEKGGRSKAIDEAGIRGRFPNFRETHHGDLEQPGSVAGVRKAIEYFVQQLPHVGTEVPAKWITIRQSLEAKSQTDPFISQDEYFKIYGAHLPFDRTKALLLSGYLHNIGAFLHFQDDLLLRRTVILQNQWATEAVFRVLDDEIVKQKLGRFTRADCDRLWHEERYADMHLELLGLMEKFELCYPLVGSREDTWLAPQLLSPSKPSSLAAWPSAADLVLSYRYSFLPRGLISRLMVRMHRFVKRLELAWVDGAFFEQQETQVLVEATAKGNEIELRARGPESKALLSVLASDLEALNDSFKGLQSKVEKWVPCVCAQCQQEVVPQMFDHAHLARRKRDGRLKIECPRSYAEVSVLELLDGLKPAQLPDWAREKEPTHARLQGNGARNTAPQEREVRIFLASSSELRVDRDEFDLYFRQQNDRLRAEGLYLKVERWENFLDAMSETRSQDDYNRKVEACDIFVGLFMTKTGKFTEEEFDAAHARFKATGKPLIFTFFKSVEVDMDSIDLDDFKTLRAFQDKLKRLEHYFTRYKSVEDLKLKFTDRLNTLRDEGLL